MRLLDRYLLRELFIPLGFCLCGFLIFYVAFDLIGSLNRFQEHLLKVGDVGELYLVKIPEILVFILPITLLLALLYALTNHSRYNELTAIRAAGVSLWRICAPYLAVGFIFSLAVFAINEFWVPDSRDRQDHIMQRRLNPRQLPAGELQFNFMFPNAREQRNWIIGLCDLKSRVLFNPHVFWKEQGTNWELLAHRAERVYGTWKFYGVLTFSTNELAAGSLNSFAAKLKKPTDNITEFIRSQLSPEAANLLQKYSGTNALELRRSLIEELNHIIQRGKLYNARRFYGVKLSPDTASLVAEEPDGSDLLELNHLLLCDAFPEELPRAPMNGVTIYSGAAKAGSHMQVSVITNLFAAPEFNETFRDFASQAKLDDYFLGSVSTEAVEIPSVEILAYLRSHPELSEKRRWGLTTQLHGRLAEPWRCLVVVLIAIPFGALSGRRNVFAGVAGSILLCFMYFILLKLGLGLGASGILYGWIAAWLPNLFFIGMGLWLMKKVQ